MRHARSAVFGLHTANAPRGGGLARWLAAGAMALAVAGCSVLGLAYDRLPTVLLWRLDSLWDLDAAQRRGLDEAARRWHQWQRREQLLAIAALLQRWQTLAAGPLDAETMCREAEAVRSLLRQATDRTADDLARWLPTLTDAQLAHWGERLAEGDQTWRRDWGAADIDQGVRLRRTRERLEMLYGRLSEEQRRWLRERLQAIDVRPDLAWAERQRRQADWLDTARRLRGQAPDVAAADVRALWSRTWRSPDPVLAAYQDQTWMQTCAWLADWHARATPEQRSRAVAQLQAYERELRALAASGASNGTTLGAGNGP